MKNRRLNVLFIAIIALAAAPQAFHDAQRLVKAAHERAETEFWSVFLSYQVPESNEAKTSGKIELVAARSQQATTESCAIEPVAARSAEAIRYSRSNETRARAKAEARRTSAQENTDVTEMVEADFDSADEVAGVYTVRPVVFSEKEQKALRAAGVHARDAERASNAASKASIASFAPGREAQMKIKQVMDMDKLMRQRNRNIKERGETLYDIQTPNTVGSM